MEILTFLFLLASVFLGTIFAKCAVDDPPPRLRRCPNAALLVFGFVVGALWPVTLPIAYWREIGSCFIVAAVWLVSKPRVEGDS